MEQKCELKANGLELIEIKSEARPFAKINWQALQEALNKNFVGNSYVVAWLDHEVRIGLWQNQNFLFYENKLSDLKYVQRLRVFDQQKELLVWRSNGEWKGRLRIDDQGEETAVVVAHQLLFGTTAKSLNGHFTEIGEKRGTKLILPFANLKVDDQRNRVFIKTHNYVKTNAVHQAGYFDCRFVAFTDDRRNELS